MEVNEIITTRGRGHQVLLPEMRGITFERRATYN